MKKIITTLTSYSLAFQLLIAPTAFSQSKKEKKKNFNIKELVFPSEVKKLSKATGSIYYNASVKDKVLIPVHFWGEISKSGLHFMPVDTNLIKGLSMAGGPRSSADLEELTITRVKGEDLQVTKYNLTDGGNSNAHKFKLQPGDTVFLRKSNFDANRGYYTGLISVFATVLSSVLLYRQVKKND